MDDTSTQDSPVPAGRAWQWEGSLPPQLSQLLRFGASGVAATVFYFLVFNLLVYGIGLSAVMSSNLAYLSALGVSYLLQSRYTFQVSDDSVGQVVKFLVTAVVGIGMSSAVMYAADCLTSVPPFVAAIVVCVLIPASNYLVFRFWVFARRN